MKKSTIKAIILVIFISLYGMSCYQWGYYQRAHDINIRINKYPNNQEECFTRNEVDNFIYGEE